MAGATPFFGRALDEDRPMLGHLLGQLLAHGLAQQVGAGQRVAADLLRDLHHLFLVHHHAVRRRQDRLQPRIGIRGALAPRLARDIVGNQLHRTRAVQRDQRDDVLEAGHRRLLQQFAHAARFELEHGGRIAVLEDRERRLVVERQRLEVDARLRVEHAHVPDRPVEDRERGEAQEVELDEPDGFDVVLVELRQDRVGVRRHVERTEIGELAGRDQHAACVHAHVARQSFQLLGQLQQLPHFLLGGFALVDERLDFARVHHVGFRVRGAPLQRHELARLKRNQLGDAVDERVGEVEHAPDVAHRGFRRQRAERDDLRHGVGAVLFLDVVDDAVAAVLAEVDVEIRHRHPLRIEEALEQQRVAQRVEVGDAERIRNERPCARSAAGTDGHMVAPRPIDEVGDDQEVTGESHLHDGPRFEVEARDVFGALRIARRRIRVQLREPPFEAGRGFVAQVLVDRHASRRRKFGQVILAQRDRQVAALRDRHGIGERLGQIGEARRHLGLRREILLRREASRTARVGEHMALGDAHARFVRPEVFAREKLDRMRGDHGQVASPPRARRWP